jgi:opacity protein-like surface antigen
MRKYLLAAAATVAIATPAFATDDSPYVGIEGGVTWPRHQTIFGTVNFTNPGTPGPVNVSRTDVASTSYKMGYDLDLIGGYDFGMFRLEGELGYKRARMKNRTVDSTFVNAINTGAGTTFSSTTSTLTTFDLSDHTSVYSGMINALGDFGGNGGIGGYLGAGAGYASVHQFTGSKSGFAWQLIAGVYMPVGSNVDIGLKYRYFNGPRNSHARDFAFAAGTTTCGVDPNTFPCSGGIASFDSSGHYRSHSLLLSLVYNFAAPEAAPAPPPPPPPPPPPAAPATQTCPDGSVIEATATCPAPPPPPPPPAPTQRGERGR